MSRKVEEWIGATDDTPIPQRVQLRVFEKHGGRCYLSGILIRGGMKWHCDHVIALINGGKNRENNLAPALVDKHKEKTKRDLATKAKTANMAKKNLGLVVKKKPWPKANRPWPKRSFKG